MKTSFKPLVAGSRTSIREMVPSALSCEKHGTDEGAGYVVEDVGGKRKAMFSGKVGAACRDVEVR
jgi:hypothetical protein